MFKRIRNLIIVLFDMLKRSNIIDNIGKGMVYGNMVNSVGGGVSIRGAL